MKLYVKSIDLQVNNKQTASLSFSDTLAVVKESYVLRCVMDAIFGINRKICANGRWSFTARVVADGEYIISGIKNAADKSFAVNVRIPDSDKDYTKEYFEVVEAGKESDDLLNFSAKTSGEYPYRLHRYKNQNDLCIEDTLGLVTNGFSCTRTFRKFLKEYIKDFSPLYLRNDFFCYFDLLPCGEFALFNEQGRVENFGKSEEFLYRYLSYVYLNDFWSKAELIRNMNSTDKPLLVSLCDESKAMIEMEDSMLCIAQNINRQTIVFVPANAYNYITEKLVKLV